MRPAVRRRVVACWLVAVAIAAEPQADDALELTLARLERTASLYRDAALRFTCDETLVYTDRTATRRYHLRYVYLRSESGGLDDHREPRGWRAAQRWAEDEAAALRAMGFPIVLVRPYSWIFVFQQALRGRYRHELDGEDRIRGRAAIRLRFEAVPPIVRDENEWAGTAWIDRESYQLLRVEAYHALDARSRRTRYTTEFDVAENGMRFPSRVFIESRFPEFQVSQLYRGYRFFSVRTAEEMRRIVLGGDGVAH